MKRALFIGRWQPLHDGHRWLFAQKLGLPLQITEPPSTILPMSLSKHIVRLNLL